MTLEGIDVSRWQSSTPNLTGLSFLFARATYGAVHDPLYQTHIANARKAGCLVGAYHFGVGDVPVPDQVSAFLAAAGSVDFYVLDLESNGRHASMTNAQATAFIAAVKAKGRKIGLYHSASGYPSLGQDYRWVASWTMTPPARPWAFWQYRGSPLDLDRFAGTLNDLRTLAGKPIPPLEAVIDKRTELYAYRAPGHFLPYGGVTTGTFLTRRVPGDFYRIVIDGKPLYLAGIAPRAGTSTPATPQLNVTWHLTGG